MNKRMDVVMMNKEKEPVRFPCSFPLKVLGMNTLEFYAVVCSVIEGQLGEKREVNYHSRTSSGGKYLSVTATFQAESREELDTIYRKLNGTGLVLMTL